MTKRAYSVFELKSFDDDERTFEGIATTPSTDRIGDIVEPRGAVYKLPITMMWQHGKGEIKEPVGWITHVKVSDSEIAVKGTFAKLDWPLSLKEELDKAWARVKSKLVRGLSIGFNSIESVPIKNSYGERFTKWEWLELSPVSIAANADASITSIKSADALLRAVSGNAQRVVRLDQPLTPASVLALPKGIPVTIKDQITQFVNKRAAAQGRIDELVKKAGDDGRTFDDAETEEYANLQVDVKKIDAHLVILREQEKQLPATATAILPQNTATPEAAAAARSSVIQVKSMAPKGIGPARLAIAMWQAKQMQASAVELCRKHWPDSPELAIYAKAIVEAADTTTSGWASQLMPAAQQLGSEFIDMYRDATIIGRIQGLHKVPFNVAVPLRTGAGTFQWVGEALPKPVTSETFDRVSLLHHKMAAITVITQELARFSSPDAEITIRDSMKATIVRALDTHFVSALAAVSGVSPAGILNGISSTATSGTTAAAFRTDMKTLINKMVTNKIPLSAITLLMSSTQAFDLALTVSDLGVALFPKLTQDGGSILNFPVIISEAVGTKIIAIVPSDILLAEDPNAIIKASDQATLEMESVPAGGEQSPPSTQSVLKSMYQTNCIAIMCEQFITWVRARTSAVEYLTGVAYVP